MKTVAVPSFPQKKKPIAENRDKTSTAETSMNYSETAEDVESSSITEPVVTSSITVMSQTL